MHHGIFNFQFCYYFRLLYVVLVWYICIKIELFLLSELEYLIKRVSINIEFTYVKL